MNYKILFVFFFTFSRLLPFVVFLFASQKISNSDYVFIENSIAISILISGLVGFGVPGLINVLKLNNSNKQLIDSHVIVFSLLLIISSLFCFYYKNFYFSSILGLSSFYIIITSLNNKLKITNKRIRSSLLESLIYFKILVCIFFLNFFFKNSFIETINIYFIYSSILIFLFYFNSFIKNKKINKNLYSIKNIRKIYQRSLKILLFGITILMFTLFPRIYAIFLEFNIQFEYLYSYRIAILALFIQQIFINYFHQDLFKKKINFVFKFSVLVSVLTLLVSLIIFFVYNFFQKYFNNFIYVDFNILINLQIFLVSILSLFNFYLLRLKIQFKTILEVILISLFYYALSFIFLRYISDDLVSFSTLHLIYGFSMLLWIIFLSKKVKI